MRNPFLIDKLLIYLEHQDSGFAMVECNSPRLQAEALSKLTHSLLSKKSAVLDWGNLDRSSSPALVFSKVIEPDPEIQVVFVIHLEGKEDTEPEERLRFVRRFNLARDAIAGLEKLFVFFLPSYFVELLLRHARDFYGFVMIHEKLEEDFLVEGLQPRNAASKEWHADPEVLRQRRLFYETQLASVSLPNNKKLDTLLALAKVQKESFEYAASLAHYREALALNQKLIDEEKTLFILQQISELLSTLGHYEEALRMLRERQLPLCESLGDLRSLAVTWGKIGDIAMVWGNLDEALRIRKEQQLPVYQQLGDVHSIALTMVQIADILVKRGMLNEALRILQEQALPVYQRLGDVRSIALTMGDIAEILVWRGELDEALHIRREQQLPVFERLGDLRELAMTWGKIGDIAMARGELDEALRIRREQQLPVFERLGDLQELAMTWGQIGEIAMARGELDEGLRIYREQVLPLYERLGDVKRVAVAQINMAVAYFKKDPLRHQDELTSLLLDSLRRLQQLGVCGSQQIQGIFAFFFDQLSKLEGASADQLRKRLQEVACNAPKSKTIDEHK